MGGNFVDSFPVVWKYKVVIPVDVDVMPCAVGFGFVDNDLHDAFMAMRLVAVK